jgi:predicted aspartyl protease
MGWSRLVAGLVAGMLLAVGAVAAGAGRTKGELASNEMAIEVYRDVLVVARGSVNGIGNLRFLLDTGATDTAIDRKVAERLGLRGQPAGVISFGKKLALERSEVQEIAFGPERIAHARVMIEDLGYLGLLGAHFDGVIGLDLLRRRSFLVDYTRKRVVFGPTAECEGGGMRMAPMRADARSVTVLVDLDGRPVWMVADTGTPLTVVYEDTLDDLPVNYSPVGTIEAQGLGGRVENRMAIVPRLRIGGQDLDTEVVLVSTPGATRLSGVSGYLGLGALDAKQVAFSFETNQLLWKK